MVSTDRDRYTVFKNIKADLLVTNFTILCQFFYAENRIQLISRNRTQRSNILKFKQIVCT
jgi:hypothetical protein